VKPPPLPFRPQPFLFRTLILIFLVECGFLAFAFVKCSQPLPNNPVPLVNERCPRLGQRSQEIFQQAMAVTLSLLGGGALASGVNQKLSSGPSPSSFSQAPSQGPAGSQPQGPAQPGGQVPGSGPASGSQEAFQDRKRKEHK